MFRLVPLLRICALILKIAIVVADAGRTEKTICLAVSPSLKAYGIPGRARLFEVVQKVREVKASRLRGFDDEISSEGANKLLVKKTELSDDKKSNLSNKLLQIRKGMIVTVLYFAQTDAGIGKYVETTGTVVMLDPVYQELKLMRKDAQRDFEKELPITISFDDIADLTGIGITDVDDNL